MELLKDFKEIYGSTSLIKPIPSPVGNLTGSNALFATQTLNSNYPFYIFHREIHADKYRYNLQFSGEKNTNRVVYTKILYSISNASRQKDKAWEFMSFLIEDEAQMIYELGSAPLNMRVHDSKMDNASANQETKGEFAEIRKEVDFMYDMGYLKQDMLKPIMEYMEGSITLDRAIEKAEYNITLRLNE